MAVCVIVDESWRVVQYTQLESICLWYLRFDKPEFDLWALFHRIDTNRFPFCRFENRVDLDFEGGLKMLSIQVDLIESTRIVRIHWSLVPRFKNEESSCIVISRILTSGGLCKVGWKCCRFESIRSNQRESFSLLLICHAGSQFARRNSVRISRTLTSGGLCRLGWKCCWF